MDEFLSDILKKKEEDRKNTVSKLLKDCATCVFKDTQIGGYPCRECYKNSNYKSAYCHCRTESIYDILDTDGTVVYIAFDGKKIVAVTFNSEGRSSGRNELPIKYCPFCGREL